MIPLHRYRPLYIARLLGSLGRTDQPSCVRMLQTHAAEGVELPTIRPRRSNRPSAAVGPESACPPGSTCYWSASCSAR